MKIGVLSDIHMTSDDGRIQKLIDHYFCDVDMFFLCGDLTSMNIYNQFLIRRVEAVAGNMDDYSVKGTLPIKRVVTLEGVTFGLIHGFGPPKNIEGRISKEFGDVDCIVYGHSHHAVNRRKGGVMYFNPGSPTDKRSAEFNSIGILHVNDGDVTGEIITLQDSVGCFLGSD